MVLLRYCVVVMLCCWFGVLLLCCRVGVVLWL